MRRQVAGSRGRSVNLTLAISPSLGVVHHDLRQITTTRLTFQGFINQLINILSPLLPQNERCVIVYDGARVHLNITVPEHERLRFQLRILPPYSPMLNPTEQAHSCFKAMVKQSLTDPETMQEIQDVDNRCQHEGLSLQDWRARILIRIGRQALDQLTVQKCQNWCARVHHYIPDCQA